MKLPYMLKYEYLKSVPVKTGAFQSHPHYEIFYFHEGQGYYLIGDKIHHLSPGTLIVMHGLTLHMPCSLDGYPYVRTLINFDQSYVRAASDHLFATNVLEPFEKLGNYVIILNEEEKAEFESILGMMQHHYMKLEKISQERFRLHFLDALFFVYDVMKKPLRSLPELSQLKERHIQTILSYIDQHLTQTLRLEHLEKDLHLNRHHIARLFREVTGMTVFQYVLKRRLNEAKLRFLTEPQSGVTDVCYLSGFKNVSHFSRAFKQQEGCSPEQFRRQLRPSS
jgi:AraC-like DNA-binding protein